MRGLTPAAEQVVTADVARRVVAAELLLDSGPVRLNTSTQSIWIGGNEFLGVGALGEISTLAEEEDLSVSRMTLALSGIPRDAIALALNEPAQNRRARIYEVPLDAAWNPIDPFIPFSGIIDSLTIEYGKTCRVIITVQNSLARWERPNNSRYTPEDLERRHPGDFGLRFIADQAEKQVVWPAKGWFMNNMS